MIYFSGTRSRRVSIVLTLATAVLSAPSLVAEQQPEKTPATKADIEQIVKEYILQHPEVLMESVRSYQQREHAAQAQRSKDAIVARLPELVRDPATPATRPFLDKSGEQVTIVEFFDYRCGYCKKVQPTLLKVLAGNPKVRVVFKELPILGPESVTAAKASLAAERQKKYIEFHDALLAATTPVTEAVIEETAKRVGLDVARLKADMESPEISALIDKNTELAAALDVSATPTFIIGSELIPGALDADGFARMIAKAGVQQ